MLLDKHYYFEQHVNLQHRTQIERLGVFIATQEVLALLIKVELKEPWPVGLSFIFVVVPDQVL